MAYTTTTCVVVTAVCLGASWLFASLRYYVRLVIIKSFQLDDAFSFLALASYTAQCGTYLLGLLEKDLGKHIADVQSVVTMSRGLRNLFIGEICFIFGTGFIKISFALTLFRLVQRRLHIYSLYTIIAITVLMTISTLFATLFSCKPISFFWNILVNPTAGTCVGRTAQISVSYAHGATMLFVDIALGIVLPLHLLSVFKMQRRVKISARLVLSIGSFASIATIIRLYHSTNQDLADFLYAANIPFLWAGVELASCIVCTSAATLKPLLVRLQIFKGSRSGGYVSGYELEDGQAGWQSKDSGSIRTEMPIRAARREADGGG